MKQAELPQMVPRKRYSSRLIVILLFLLNVTVSDHTSSTQGLSGNEKLSCPQWISGSEQCWATKAGQSILTQVLPAAPCGHADGPWHGHRPCAGDSPESLPSSYHRCAAMLLHAELLPGGKISAGQWIPVSKWDQEAAVLWHALVQAIKGRCKNQQYYSPQIKFLIQNF